MEDHDLRAMVEKMVRGNDRAERRRQHTDRMARIHRRYGFVIEPWGDDAEFLLAYGHVDLAAFKRQAFSVALRRAGWGLDPADVDLLPEHRWMVLDYTTENGEDIYRWGGVSADAKGAVAVTMADLW